MKTVIQTTLIAAGGITLLMALFTAFEHHAIGRERPYLKRLQEYHEDFDRSFVDWSKAVNKHGTLASPSSPDFPDKVRGEWQERDLSNKFRRLEELVREGR